MSGFVYIWYDRKRKMFYIGSHWGSTADRYICSSQRMSQAYKRRPENFKRRIVSRVSSSRHDLLMEEQRWLYMIPEQQLGKKYYNLRTMTTTYWHTFGEGLKTKEKISASVKAHFQTEEGQRAKERFSKAYTGKKQGPRDPSVGKKISESLKGKSLTEEHKEKVRQTLTGRNLSDEHKAAIKKSHNRDYSCPEFKRKCSEARRRTVEAKRLASL
jgi:hypothetical protein